MRADPKPSDPRAYRVAGVGLLAAAVLAAGCGSDDASDALNQVTDQANEVRQDLRSGACAKDIKSDACGDEVRAKLREMEDDASDKGDDARREAKKLRRQLEQKLR